MRVSSLPGTQLLDHSRSPQMCSSAVLLGAVLVHAPLVVCPRPLLSPPFFFLFFLSRKNFAGGFGLEFVLVLTLFILKAPNYVLARTLTERVV